jgi:CBS domain-containing protein
MITTIVFLAELFGAHAVIPIILATVVAFFVSSADSFYPFQPLNNAYKEELALERLYYKVSRKWRRELEKLGAKDVMTPNPIGLRPEMSVLQAFEEFSKTSFRSMPVVDERNVLLGYVTLEDLASLSKTALASPLHSTGLHSPLTFKEDESVVKVIEDMIEGKVDHAFVTDEESKLRGIISGIDVVRLLLRYYTHL